jgi:phosphate binding protein
MKNKRFKQSGITVLSALFLLAGCSSNEELRIRIDGSVTVAPVTQAAVEDFAQTNRDIEISVSNAGTGGGFKRFINGETDVHNASRTIKESEIADAAANGIEYYELEVGKDAIVIAVNKENTWIQNVTSEDLYNIYRADSTINNWSDLDNNWPNEKINLYTPANDSGTFDYFHTVIMNHEEVRNDVTSSQDLNVLVTGVNGDENAIGFFGYAYYVSSKDKIRPLSVNGVEPTEEAVMNELYQPLSRSLYIYVNKASYNEKQAVKSFIDYYLEHARALVIEIGYPPLSDDRYAEQKAKLK